MMFDNSNAGREFVLSFPPCYENSSSDNSHRLYISSPFATQVTVEIPRLNYSVSKVTTPYDVVEFTLTPDEAQPYRKAPHEQPPVEQVYKQAAIYVTAGAPIVLYGVTRYRFTSDGFLGLPVSALGTDYIVSSYADMSSIYPGQSLPSEATVCAAFDDTRVEFTLGGNPATQTPGGMNPGDTETYTLNRGDVLALSSIGPGADLSGSRLIASKPVAVLSANYCANVPLETRWCDYIVGMEKPTNSWSKEYQVTPFHGRLANSWIKVFASEPNTTVYRNGDVFGVIQEAGGLEGVGHLHAQVAEGEPGAFTISADKPISVTQYNPGQELDNVKADPYKIELTPVAQYLKEIWFNTPGILGGLGFDNNFVNVVYELDGNNQIPVELELGQVVDGNIEWNPVKELFGEAIGHTFPLSANGKRYASKALELPGDGVYVIRSLTPFTAYSYGSSPFDTYGFATGNRLADLQTDDDDAPIAVFDKGPDGSISGSVSDPGGDTKRSNLAAVHLIPSASENYRLVVNDFVPGQSDKAEWSLQIIDAGQKARALLAFVDRRGNSSTLAIGHNVIKMAVSDYDLRYEVKKGQRLERTIRIINESDEDKLVLTRLELEDGSAGFRIDSPPTLPLTLDAFSSEGSSHYLDLQLSFLAENSGSYSDRLGIGSEDSFEYYTELSGIAQAAKIATADLDFGTLQVGDSQQLIAVLRNSGPVPLEISSLQLPSNPAFRVLVPERLQQLPTLVEVGETIDIEVEFAPQIPGAYQDAIVFNSDAENGDNTIALDGDGVPGSPTSVGELGGPISFLGAVVPNPVRDFARIDYQLRTPGNLFVRILSLRGDVVKTLSSGYRPAGTGTLRLSLVELPAGLYYYQLEINGTTQTRKLIRRN